MKHTKGNWKQGNTGECIVSDIKPVGQSEESTKYYGGQVICESVQNKADLSLIAAAPKLLAFAVRIAKSEGYQIAYDIVELSLGRKVSFSEMIVLDKKLNGKM